ncbi:hypothetical protein INT48_003320 [Thamnidium elegans]|uniref:Uncharacterized protein n=1 Tax=Thamnidium elegans TaxID=101142 RepID=A0A8H7SJF5_9FUNG|nr:hypothetical protein INT48_003320 [Thamnidium elegans]
MSKKNNTRKFSSLKKSDENGNGIPTSNPNDVLDREVAAPDSTIVEADQANKPVSSYSFFSRVLSIPLVRDGSSIVQHYANQNSVSRFALNKAESTIKMAASIASPYTEKYKHHLLKADQMGCQSLDVVENKFPVVRQDTGELFTTVKQSPQRVYKDVREKMSHVVQVPVNHATEIVNRYLPAVEQSDRAVVDENRKLLSLVNEFKERLTHRVTTQLQSIPHSKADVARLAETNQLLQEAFQSIQKANTRLQDFVISVKGGYTSTQNKANQRINELTIDLIKRLDSAAAYVKERQMISNLPSSLHVVVDPLVNFASNEYEIVRTEMLKDDVAPLKKATNIMHLTQEYVLPLIHNSIQGVQEQVRQYSNYANNSKVVQEVRSTFGLVTVKA